MSNLNQTPSGDRIQISFFGTTNSGKSTLINSLTGQNISIVSDVKGTTTDPVSKAMELLPLGPVIICDTAGFDDDTDLGTLRIKKTYDVLRKTHLAILVLKGHERVSKIEMEFLEELRNRKIPAFIVINEFADKKQNDSLEEDVKKITDIPVLKADCSNPMLVERIKDYIAENYKPTRERTVLEGLVEEGDLIALVTPIDASAPKDRMILPQVQVLRDALDKHAIVVTVQPEELDFVSNFILPSLIITDSQVFNEVKDKIPEHYNLTSFSILFARKKGDLKTLVEGIEGLKALKDKQRVRILIAEGCSHHRQQGDIGRDKMPEWIAKVIGRAVDTIEFIWSSGTGFADDMDEIDAIVHCGGCMLNAKEMKYRIQTAIDANIPITNYGMLIAEAEGILERALRAIPIKE